ncbi:NAD-dependent epimerase/dehydratase family protein [Desulfurococcus mucosus]|uniref:NAD-dependent epimerase/dehydratase family protein n=1 Tax=Desulfurococcus mucosus TaxID=2275 RepID=UPI00069A6D9B|nr:NAD-dependent epimerase/dehydratase family protein [Desulfurococcus mucosus]
MRILVTGGAGFIGSHLVAELLRLGYEVVVLDDLSTGSLGNLRGLLGSVEFVKGDVRDYGVVEGVAKKAEAVVHLAALIDVAESVEKPDLYFDVNVLGTYNVAKASRNTSVLVYASSSAVYGEPVETPIREDHPLTSSPP